MTETHLEFHHGLLILLSQNRMTVAAKENTLRLWTSKQKIVSFFILVHLCMVLYDRDNDNRSSSLHMPRCWHFSAYSMFHLKVLIRREASKYADFKKSSTEIDNLTIADLIYLILSLFSLYVYTLQFKTKSCEASWGTQIKCCYTHIWHTLLKVLLQSLLWFLFAQMDNRVGCIGFKSILHSITYQALPVKPGCLQIIW